MRDTLYFAYGSNMDLGQMEARCGNNFKLLGKAVLEGWEFYINNRSKANIAIDTTRPDSVVYGILFKINEDALGSLDRSEGNNKIPKIYDREKEKGNFNGDDVGAWVYVDKNNLGTGKSDQSDYLERIIKTASKFKFPPEYIKHIESFK